jgi:NAD+ kinase
MTVAIFGRKFHASYSDAVPALLEMIAAHGEGLCYHSGFLACLPESILSGLPVGGTFSSCRDLPSDCGLLLSLGGDGTFLSSLTAVRDSGIPVAGINFGRLGFLTAAKMDSQANAWLGDLLEGRYRIEPRTVLEMQCEGMQPGFYPYAINEAVAQRRGPEMLSIDISIDGSKLPTYWADGILVATPTGSTAYSLSIGGPIVRPDAEVLIISPIAPHNLNVRPMIVPDGSVIELSVNSRGGDALLTMDNRIAEVPSGKRLTFRKAPFTVQSVALENSNFIGALQEKLFWGEDKRNDRQQ